MPLFSLVSTSRGGLNIPNSQFFIPPRLFTSFPLKGLSDSEAEMSPTSILDNKPFSNSGSSFCSDKKPKFSKRNIDHKHQWGRIDSRGVGLGIVDALNEDSDGDFRKTDSRMVLFGSKLKIQIPPILPSTGGSPRSPSDFGINTRNSVSGPFSPAPSPCSGLRYPSASASREPESNDSMVFTGCLSAGEMELSEDYTCVISHGPNPRTTHIFDNCIVEDCGSVRFFPAGKENGFFQNRPSHPSEDFLSFCYGCKRSLGLGKDIYMYRGEKAFCSRECRQHEMLLDEHREKGASESFYP